MNNQQYAPFDGARPYFQLVRDALGDLVDGEHFFDAVADDIVYEVLYDISGWPRVITGRLELMDRFKAYCERVELHSVDKLIVHQGLSTQVVVIEYEVHGTILATHVPYNNRFCSIVAVANRRIAHWRDYMDSLAAWNALTARIKS